MQIHKAAFCCNQIDLLKQRQWSAQSAPLISFFLNFTFVKCIQISKEIKNKLIIDKLFYLNSLLK